jgi:hypothetical protein
MRLRPRAPPDLSERAREREREKVGKREREMRSRLRMRLRHRVLGVDAGWEGRGRRLHTKPSSCYQL